MNSEPEDDLGISGQEGQSKTVSPGAFVEAARRRGFYPGTAETRERERTFLQTFIFADLPMLNPSWDSEQIAHFTKTDFLTVLDRCSKADVTVFGVEVFIEDGTFMDISIPTSPTDRSHRDFVTSLPDQPRLNFCAFYGLDGVFTDGADQTRQSA